MTLGIISYIKRIAIFMIFLTFVEVIVPKTKFKEYIGVLMGIMLVFLVLQPVSSLFANNGGNLERQFEDFQVNYQKKLLFAGSDNTEAWHKIVETYEKNIASQAKSLIELSTDFKVLHISVESNPEQEQIGEIEKIYIRLKQKEVSEEKRSFIYIEPIQIHTNSEREETEVAKQPEEMIAVRKLVSDYYQISPEQIYMILE